jgi:hypothetical protein
MLPTTIQKIQMTKRAIGNDPVALIESIYRIRDNKGNLIDYEMAEDFKPIIRTGLLGDCSCLYRIGNKGRQIGASVFLTIEDATIAAAFPRTFQFYVATKEKQAKNWLRKVEGITKDCRLFETGDGLGHRLIDIDTAKSSQLEKVFRHMPKDMRKEVELSYICGLAASPEGSRGDTAIKVDFDEFAHFVQRVDQQRAMYDALTPFVSQGGCLGIWSTPLVRTDMFWDIYINAEKKMFTPFYLPAIKNWKDLDLHNDLRSQPYILSHKHVSIEELERKRRDDLDYFKQEHLGIPVDVLYRFITPELLQSCVGNHKPELFVIPDRGYFIVVGVDVAQKRDLTAVTVLRVYNDGRREEIFIHETQADYKVQTDDLVDICKRYDPVEVRIDVTDGAGLSLADHLAYKTLTPIRKVDFRTVVELRGEEKQSAKEEEFCTGKMKIKEYMAIEFKKTLINKQYLLLDHEVALSHVLKIEKQTSESGMIRYSGKKYGRDDHFWSKSMANMDLDQLKMGLPVFSSLVEKNRTIPRSDAQPCVLDRGGDVLVI